MRKQLPAAQGEQMKISREKLESCARVDIRPDPSNVAAFQAIAVYLGHGAYARGTTEQDARDRAIARLSADLETIAAQSAAAAASERCNLCFGRGYRPKARANDRGGFIALTCRRCSGSGSVPAGSRNPDRRSDQLRTRGERAGGRDPDPDPPRPR